MFILLVFILFFDVKAESPSIQNQSPSQDVAPNFKTNLPVAIGILACLVLSLAFTLLVFAKFCHGVSSVHTQQIQVAGLVRSQSRLSGINRTVVDSLPLFRFSSLRGSRKGLECAVCLSKFEDTEILRLLPKCKHAFHVDCIDQWLEKHSSCPLCRNQVSADDLSCFTYSNSTRFLLNLPEVQEDSNFEFFVEREDDHQGSSRYFRKFQKGKREAELRLHGSCDNVEISKNLHKKKHTIIVSDVICRNRWSNVSSSDLVFLNSEMLKRLSSMDSNNEQPETVRVIDDCKIVNIKEELETKRVFEIKCCKIKQTDSFPSSGFPAASDSGTNSSYTSKVLNHTERSLSDITVHPRFTEFNMENNTAESSTGKNVEERMRRLWFSIAQRTIKWSVNREKSSPRSQILKQTLNV